MMNVLKVGKIKLLAAGMVLATAGILGGLTVQNAEAAGCNCQGPPAGVCYSWGQTASVAGGTIVCCQRVHGWILYGMC